MPTTVRILTPRSGQLTDENGNAITDENGRPNSFFTQERGDIVEVSDAEAARLIAAQAAEAV